MRLKIVQSIKLFHRVGMRRCKQVCEVVLGLGIGLASGVTYGRMNGAVRASNLQFGEKTCEGLECPVTKWDDDWDKRAGFDNDSTANHYLLVSPGPVDEATGQLTSTGNQIAEKLAYRLAKMNLAFRSVVTSPQPRWRSTAETVAKTLKIPVEESPMLSPVIPSNTVPPTLNDDHVLFKGSQIAEAAFRETFFRNVQPEDSPVVKIYVTPANLIRFFICRALQFPPEAWLRFNVSKGSITWLTVHSNGTVEVRCIGEETGVLY